VGLGFEEAAEFLARGRLAVGDQNADPLGWFRPGGRRQRRLDRCQARRSESRCSIRFVQLSFDLRSGLRRLLVLPIAGVAHGWSCRAVHSVRTSRNRQNLCDDITTLTAQEKAPAWMGPKKPPSAASRRSSERDASSIEDCQETGQRRLSQFV